MVAVVRLNTDAFGDQAAVFEDHADMLETLRPWMFAEHYEMLRNDPGSWRPQGYGMGPFPWSIRDGPRNAMNALLTIGRESGAAAELRRIYCWSDGVAPRGPACFLPNEWWADPEEWRLSSV